MNDAHTYIVQAGERPGYDSLTNLLTDGWSEDTTILELDGNGETVALTCVGALRIRYETDLDRRLSTETSRSRAAERLLNRALADNEALTERLHELEAENAALRLADEPRRLALLNEMMEKMFGVRVDIT
jgi:hypothetical protein